MPMWQYAQLMIRTDRGLGGGSTRTVLWREPGSSTVKNYSASRQPVTVLLNRFGADGWELVGLQNYREAPPRPGQEDQGRLVSQYIFKRPIVPTLISLTVYRRPEGDAAQGRLLIERKVARPYQQADIDRIDALRIEREDPATSERRREQIDEAVAGYAESFLTAQVGDAWWETAGDVPLARAAELLDGSAEWLRGLIEHRLEGMASAAGADGPVVSVGAETTTNFVTARPAEPLDEATRLCELAGIVVGLAVGGHPLVMACAKPLAPDDLSRALSREFTKILASIGEEGAGPDREAPEVAEPGNGPDGDDGLDDAGQGWR